MSGTSRGEYEESGQREVASLFGYGTVPVPSSDVFAGVDGIITIDVTAPGDGNVLGALLALCVGWPQVADPVAASAWLAVAVPTLSDFELIDFNDVALSSAEALGDIAPALATAWRVVIEADGGTRGSIALEGWTRLAVGGWTASTPVRGALHVRVDRSASDVHPDVFLVRSIGAALDQWPEPELELALERLTHFEDVESDAAFELGMTAIRKAVQAGSIQDAVDELSGAHEWFVRACVEGDRPDAIAFATASTAVAGFLGHRAVSEEDVNTIEDAAREWSLGYLNEVPNWRQPRAETASAWAALVRDLRLVGDLDAAASWLDTTSLIATIGHVYSAHNSSKLVAHPNVLTREAARVGDVPEGIPVALGPRLDAALGASAERVRLLDNWLRVTGERLDDAGEPLKSDLAAVEAIRSARERLREGPVPRGKVEASREDDIPSDPREALAAVVGADQSDRILQLALAVGMAESFVTRDELPGGLQAKTLDEDLLLKRLLTELAVILPVEYGIWSSHLATFLQPLIRIVKATINRGQGGERSYEWHRAAEGGTPREHLLVVCLSFG